MPLDEEQLHDIEQQVYLWAPKRKALVDNLIDEIRDLNRTVVKMQEVEGALMAIKELIDSALAKAPNGQA